MNALDPFGQGYFLPRGFLRESVSSLSRADLIILNHVNEKTQFESIKQEIQKFSQAPLIGTKIEPVDILNLKTFPKQIWVEKVGVFAPLLILNILQDPWKLGLQAVDHEYRQDHLAFSKEELKNFGHAASQKEPIGLYAPRKIL